MALGDGVAMSVLPWILLCPACLLRDTPPRQVIPSPDGLYEARVHTYVLDGLIPGMPGSGSDRACEVELIRLADGASLGVIPVSMVQNVDLSWGETTVDLKLAGAWDLATGRCERWVDDGNRLVSCGWGGLWR